AASVDVIKATLKGGVHRSPPRRGVGGSRRDGTRKGADDKTTATKAKRKQNIQRDDEISSDSEKESDGERGKKEEENDLEVEETAQEKKLRLTKLYLEQLRTEEEDKADDRAFRHDVIADRLQDELMEQSGTLQRQIAKELRLPGPGAVRVLRGHQLPIVCLVISPDSKHIFSASKDCTLIKWDVESGRRVLSVPGLKKKDKSGVDGHAAHVLCMAISSDGKYLATGDRDNLILLWNPATMQLLHTFKGHRDTAPGLCFRKGTHQLYSASHDRSVKVWNVDERAYVETLFNRQSSIARLPCYGREATVYKRGRVGTMKPWILWEEGEVVYYLRMGSIDCIQLINEEHMVSGADDGSLALWGLHKKRPLATVQKAHGMLGEPGLEQPQWITSVAAMLNSDVVASGSHDGHIRLWKCGASFKSLEPLFTVPLV
uniref:Ribosomal RNA processing 9, U3 small nucleolar RNA binding protein n=1 Tax=Petromyzon marinus TaxID=7757 RepID=S4R828_PETMA